ncbi:DUF6510 family protein [Actinomadura madurae]|uniref:DUF6510 family protein n=1 Tax=Actinomadura madurae TaxID=1993 RepID=UPI0020274210|nr:DUF6510 family protein [Actinomadura madurae]MCP9951783.1 DUF6510 family protein [Actinomadura madurae]MCP9968553.1 DUF6510 family protein [Actinomadura madurae]MCP9981022.1 DUF6510 family protein [Actinomadura madurae]MCQ0007476.1 DUF6510 family protein [Actinomadura madurae]MCQ0017220.1 DUF6510 family protein [Actinomadura madurae]
MTVPHRDSPGAPAPVDGNALAGPLGEVFAVDVTAAVGRCANCGLTGPVAALRVYDRAPGMVARCPGCDHVVLRLVRTPDAAWLDLTGAVSLHIQLPPAEAT